MEYKILFCDMDHTLLNEDLGIDEGNRKAIASLLHKVIPFVICTGRGVYGIEQYADELNLVSAQNDNDPKDSSIPSNYAICQNGATVYKLPKELVLTIDFPASRLHPIFELAHHYDIDIQLYYDRLLMGERITERVKKYLLRVNGEMTLIPNALEYSGTLTKCLLNGDRNKLLQIKEKAQALLSDKCNIFFSDKEYLEFTDIQVSKGNAMLRLAKQLGYRQEEVVAIGDSENDLSMIQSAGLGIAVSNAVPVVKSSAAYITTANCNENAVQEVIDKFF